MAVKSWSSVGQTVAVAVAAWVSSGCAAHLTGLVDRSADGLSLSTPEGRHYRLVAVGDAAPLVHLDGHIAEVEGRRVFRTVTVTDWSVPQGLHGMPAWVGTLERRGVQLGLSDRNSGTFWWLDPVAAETLAPYVGVPVLVEGYVEGAQRIVVVYYRVLDGRPGEGGE